jgi:hypothetical protein
MFPYVTRGVARVATSRASIHEGCAYGSPLVDEVAERVAAPQGQDLDELHLVGAPSRSASNPPRASAFAWHRVARG